MKKFTNLMRKDVQVHTSHLWIIGLGTVVALGFLVNCGIAPFVPCCQSIDWLQLFLSASIIAGIGTARQWALMPFKYINAKNLEDEKASEEETETSAEKILRERIWVPCIGWCLVIGFAINMLVVPFFHEVKTVDWSLLQASISMFLTLSAARERIIYGHDAKND